MYFFYIIGLNSLFYVFFLLILIKIIIFHGLIIIFIIEIKTLLLN